MRFIEDFSRLNALTLLPPDIIVSELLGSFGDNELSPECLDGVTSFMNAETICIPRSYRSFIGLFYVVFFEPFIDQRNSL